MRSLIGSSWIPGFLIVAFSVALSTAGFTYLFGTKSAAAQLIIVGLLAGLIGFVLALDYPFTGDLAIEPEAMREVMEVWRPRLNR